METGLIILKLVLCLSLAVVGSYAQSRPGICDQVECPTYKVIESWNGYEIREYNSLVWMSTPPIPSSSIIEAAKSGFQRLFGYIKGNNKSNTKMNMTAPVVIKLPGQSSYTVSFYLSKKYQSNPPQANGLTAQSWNQTYVVVRQFGGFLSDIVAKNEVEALMDSLKGSKWIGSIDKSNSSYLVASYNSPFQVNGRINEIMVPFDM